MQANSRQSGMTFWGLMVVAALFAFFVIMTFKLLPPYLEYGKVKTAIENVAHQPDAATMDLTQFRIAMDKRFDIDDVNDIDTSKVLSLEKKPGVTIFRIVYEKRVPMAYNVTALINFDHSVQVNAR
jgi:Domain of unknown function (DUF4845)